MTNRDYLITIENQIDTISSHESGSQIIDFVLKEKFGANSIYEVHPNRYPDLFHELFDIETGLD